MPFSDPSTALEQRATWCHMSLNVNNPCGDLQPGVENSDIRQRNRFEDAFGRMVWDYYRGRYDGSGIYRSHTGERRDGHPEWYFGERWSASVDRALARVRERAGRVLDIGCGAGKHATCLQRRNVAVVGGDPSLGAVRTALVRGLDAVAVMDLRALPVRDGAVDVVLVLGTQLGVVRTVPGLRDALGEFARVTGSRGRIVADVTHPGRYVADVRAGERLDELTRMDLSAGIARRCMRTEYRELVGPWIDLLMLDPAALRAAVVPTSWTVTDLIDEGGRDYVVVLDRGRGGD